MMPKPRWLPAWPFPFDPTRLAHNMTDSARRERLPSRRPSITRTVNWAGSEFSVSVGYRPDSGQPAEVFVDGAKAGSDLRAILADASVLLSLCLQYGIEPAALSHSMARAPVSATETKPASVLGAVVEMLAEGPEVAKAEATR